MVHQEDWGNTHTGPVENFQLVGTPAQNALVQRALLACDFPFDRLTKRPIPVEWVDLSAYGARARVFGDDRGHDHHTGEFDLLEVRRRVLGLAWYSGKVSLDLSLENDPQLAAEVFLAEGAHMVDFFYMTDAMREAVWDAFHPGSDSNIGDHGHDWFDVDTYRTWVGEAFMGGFIKAYAPSIPVTIPFVHEATDAAGRAIRKALTPDLAEPQFCGCRLSKVFHRCGAHRYSCSYAKWDTAQEAVAAGRRPCRKCLGG